MAKNNEDLIPIDGKKEAAELLGALDTAHRERILSEIAIKNPELAQQLRKGLFQFSQVLALEATELQKVIRSHDQKLFALALRGIDAETKKNLYLKFPERFVRALEDEILSMGPQKVSDVKVAQERLVETARVMHEKKEITLK